MGDGGFQYQIYPDQQLVIQHFQGDIDAAGLQRAADTLVRDPAFSPNFPFLLDFRRGRMRLDIRAAPAWAVLLGQEPLSGSGGRAFLVTEAIETAMCLLVARRAPSRRVEVFSTEQGAYHWLGVARPPAADRGVRGRFGIRAGVAQPGHGASYWERQTDEF